MTRSTSGRTSRPRHDGIPNRLWLAQLLGIGLLGALFMGAGIAASVEAPAVPPAHQVARPAPGQ